MGVHHVCNFELVLKEPHKNEPVGSWSRELLAATHKDKSPCALVAMIMPAVLAIFFAIFVAVCLIVAAGHRAAGWWLMVTSALSFFSQAGPPWTMNLTGNIGEVIWLLGIVV